MILNIFKGGQNGVRFSYEYDEDESMILKTQIKGEVSYFCSWKCN